MNSDIKKLTKARKQIANEFENSIVSPPKQKNHSHVRALIITNHQNNSKIDKRKIDHQNPLENHHHLHQYLL